MRPDLRKEIVAALHQAATLTGDSRLQAAWDRLALEVGTELSEGDEVECPTAKYNQQFLNEDGPQVGDIVALAEPLRDRGSGEVISSFGGGTLRTLIVDWSDTTAEHSPDVLNVLDRTGRARTMTVAYVSWHDDVVLLVDDDGCNAEIVKHEQCIRVER